MLLGYDWRLALLCLVFAPISYYIAEQMKTLVQRTGAANKGEHRPPERRHTGPGVRRADLPRVWL